MSDNQKKILEMLSSNKISADEAYRLLNLIEHEEGKQENAEKTGPEGRPRAQYLRVTVLPGHDDDSPGNGDRVNIRVPLSLIRAGIKLTSLIPLEAMDKLDDTLREKGINFDVRSLKSEDLEELIGALSDLEVDVVSGKGEKVKVFVE